jgi:hypothetical protein
MANSCAECAYFFRLPVTASDVANYTDSQFSKVSPIYLTRIGQCRKDLPENAPGVINSWALITDDKWCGHFKDKR